MAAESMQSIFKRIDNALRLDEGCSTELDYIEQSSWVLFLKYLDALESERNLQAEINQKQYSYIIKEEYRWHSWATPLNSDGSKSLDKLTGSDLIIFVEKDLFSYLAGFRLRATSPDTIEYKIGMIFDEIRNRFRSGYQLREVIDAVEDLEFGTSSQNHEMSTLYEEKIKRMGNAGRNGGEYYTPRPLIRSLIQVIDPQVGETIYDGAVGSAGFLCEAFEHLMSKDNLLPPELYCLVIVFPYCQIYSLGVLVRSHNPFSVLWNHINPKTIHTTNVHFQKHVVVPAV